MNIHLADACARSCLKCKTTVLCVISEIPKILGLQTYMVGVFFILKSDLELECLFKNTGLQCVLAQGNRNDDVDAINNDEKFF